MYGAGGNSLTGLLVRLRQRLSWINDKTTLHPTPTSGDHVDEIHKAREKRNGAGTFGFLVTLKKMNGVKDAAEGLRGLSWRTDHD
jgi:hypothetical protein